MSRPEPSLFDDLHEARRRVARAPSDWKSYEALYVAWAKIGEPAAAWQALRSCLTLEPSNTKLQCRAIRFLLGTRDYETAYGCARELIESNPDLTEALLLGIEAGIEYGAYEHLAAWSERLALNAPEQSARTALTLARLGRYTRAREILENRVNSTEDAEALAVSAHLLLWENEVEAAKDLAIRAYTLRDSCTLARMVEGACRLRLGETEAANRRFTELVSRNEPRNPLPLVERSTILCWASLTHFAMGNLERAARTAERAMGTPGPKNLAAHLIRSKMVSIDRTAISGRRRKPRAGLEMDPSKRILDIWSYRELLARIEPIVDEPYRSWSGVEADIRSAMDQALKRLGNNLSPYPSIRKDEATFHPFLPPLWPRNEARKIQHLLRTRDADTVLSAFVRLQKRLPDSITPFTYMGETLLWMGRTKAARKQLLEAIERDITTQWAWIGLGACELLDGRPREAISVFRTGIENCRFEGPTMYVYRAECWYRLGDSDRARSDIDKAISAKPQRISAWLLRSRFDLENGDSTLALALIDVLAKACPHLWEAMDVQRRGLEAGIDWAIAAMKGNRSSSLPFFFRDSAPQPAFLRWERRHYATLWSVIPELPRPSPQRWVDELPEFCRQGGCGPRCRNLETLQSWIGPAAGLSRWIRDSKVGKHCKTAARNHLWELQRQRRGTCPDLSTLRVAARALLSTIDGESVDSEDIRELCRMLATQIRETPRD